MSLESAVDFRIEDGMLVIGVDPNKDGQNVVEVKVNIAEVPDEVMDVIQNLSGE